MIAEKFLLKESIFYSKFFKKNYNLNGEAYKVELSHQIADMIGFRVETVIRDIKKLQEKKLIDMQRTKIYM